MVLWVSRILLVLTCPRGAADMRGAPLPLRYRPCRTLCILRPANLKSKRVPPPWRCQEKIPAPRPQIEEPQLHYTVLSRVRRCNSTGVWAVCISTNCRHTFLPSTPLGSSNTHRAHIAVPPPEPLVRTAKQPDRLGLARWFSEPYIATYGQHITGLCP